jgi:hypothetical protein
MELTSQLQSCSAKELHQERRKDLALQVIKNEKTITRVAQENNVSRKFVHGLQNTALDSINQSFLPKTKSDNTVLFNLPVTKSWLQQFSLSLSMNCHSSFRGIQKVLNDVFDHDISIGTLHNISNEAVQKAKQNVCRRHTIKDDSAWMLKTWRKL